MWDFVFFLFLVLSFTFISVLFCVSDPFGYSNMTLESVILGFSIYVFLCSQFIRISIQTSCIDWIMFCYILSNQIIALSGTIVTCYPLSYKNIVVYPVHFLLTENIKRGNQVIIT